MPCAGGLIDITSYEHTTHIPKLPTLSHPLLPPAPSLNTFKGIHTIVMTPCTAPLS